MPTNKQRRATAKRKLQRQIERREKRSRRRRIAITAGLSTIVVAAIAAGVVTFVMNDSDSDTTASEPTTTPAPNDGTSALPPFNPPPGLGADCAYPPTAEQVAESVEPPRSGEVKTDPAQISVSMVTNEGPIGIQLDNAKAPCTVNNFASLAQKGFYNDTPCHRLTTSPELAVLQCGDPTGKGAGGPGYSFADEYPVNQYSADDPAAGQPIVYPRGTLAMANTGPNTNGSQFFMVYRDSKLPPKYTAFGTIDDTGLATLDKIAAGGVEGGGTDGPPAIPVTVQSVRLD